MPSASKAARSRRLNSMAVHPLFAGLGRAGDTDLDRGLADLVDAASLWRLAQPAGEFGVGHELAADAVDNREDAVKVAVVRHCDREVHARSRGSGCRDLDRTVGDEVGRAVEVAQHGAPQVDVFDVADAATRSSAQPDEVALPYWFSIDLEAVDHVSDEILGAETNSETDEPKLRLSVARRSRQTPARSSRLQRA